MARRRRGEKCVTKDHSPEAAALCLLHLLQLTSSTSPNPPRLFLGRYKAVHFSPKPSVVSVHQFYPVSSFSFKYAKSAGSGSPSVSYPKTLRYSPAHPTSSKASKLFPNPGLALLQRASWSGDGESHVTPTFHYNCFQGFGRPVTYWSPHLLFPV